MPSGHARGIRSSRLSYLLFILTFLLPLSLTLPCTYQNPTIDDVILGVTPLVEAEEEGRGRDKRAAPFLPEAVVHEDFEPLRIHLHYDETIESLSPDKQLYVNSSLLPEAVGFWERALRVRRSVHPLLLKRKCIESYYLLDKRAGSLACGKACAPSTVCGESVIPAEHLQPCHFCLDAGGCGRVGQAGQGIPSADFVLYVSSSHSSRCDRNDTLAYAAHCQLDALLDRPIAGHVNLCPSALSTHTHDQELLVSTVKHEILHALAFSAGLFAFFRDSKGKPRTKRNQYGKPVTLNREKGYYEWDSNTIDTILRPSWWTAEGPVVHSVQVLVTPRVREEARRHFGCDGLEGAELENQGGDGTALTHWEKRVYENEAMTGTHTQNPVYSRITFALLEDTGWYKPNYEIAEELHWGAGLGCDFALKSCGEWIDKRRENNSSLLPFCDHIKHDGRRSLAVTKCTMQRDSVALCNLIPFSSPLPRQFRNLASLGGVQQAGLRYYGGSVELADFCPYNQEFEWKTTTASSSSKERRRDSRCEIESNRAEEDDLLEIYGESSRCIDLAKAWTERKCGRVRTFAHYMAGCYHHECINGTLHIGVFNSTELYPCYGSGQPIHIRRMISGWLREGILACPECTELCKECREALADPPQDIGDPPLAEPCSSSMITSFITLLLLVFFSPYLPAFPLFHL